LQRNWRVHLLGAIAICVFGLVAWTATTTARPQQAKPDFSGQATAVSATVLGINTVISDTRPLPASGASQQPSSLHATLPGLLSAEVLHATTVGQGDRSRSEASVANLNLTVGGNSIAAGFLMSRAQAVCSSNTASASGSSEIASLTVNGQTIVVGTEPNQTIA